MRDAPPDGGLEREVEREVERWLYREAELLDDGRFGEWLELLADDVVYRMPVRTTRERGAGAGVSFEMEHFYDDIATLRLRVERLGTEYAWAEDPPSRTRRFVANVRVGPGPSADEVEARSYFLVYRNRGDSPGQDLISGERRDVLRRAGGGWRLARRTILVDQATLGTKSLAIFL
jgi:3-phenylpropionate/cinnamic acid dioxygenase small subunit